MGDVDFFPVKYLFTVDKKIWGGLLRQIYIVGSVFHTIKRHLLNIKLIWGSLLHTETVILVAIYAKKILGWGILKKGPDILVTGHCLIIESGNCHQVLIVLFLMKILLTCKVHILYDNV